ncbi:MAG: diaminopimelate epimerase [Pseudomonadota bacterium]
MTSKPHIPFRKMNGLGNDFVVIDHRSSHVELSGPLIKYIADREQGVGCDQVIVLEHPKGEAKDGPNSADVFMRIYNSDGGQVDACGNATRCVAALMVAETERTENTIQTNAGMLGAVMNADMSVTIDMGVPRFHWQDIPLSEEFYDTRMIELQVGPIDDPVLHSPSAVNVGNPHCIFWVDDIEAYDLASIGPVLEYHPLFPERANISLAHVTSDNALTLKVWERGVGLTQACGTAACAGAVAAKRKRLTGRDVTVTLPGGDLHISWREHDEHILMTGPVELEYEGEIDVS